MVIVRHGARLGADLRRLDATVCWYTSVCEQSTQPRTSGGSGCSHYGAVRTLRFAKISFQVILVQDAPCRS